MPLIRCHSPNGNAKERFPQSRRIFHLITLNLNPPEVSRKDIKVNTRGMGEFVFLKPFGPFDDGEASRIRPLLQAQFGGVAPKRKTVEVDMVDRRLGGMMMNIYIGRASHMAIFASGQGVDDPPRQHGFPGSQIAVQEDDRPGL
jgi:hypothetical protein